MAYANRTRKQWSHLLCVWCVCSVALVARSAEAPPVSLQPFSAETNYMSAIGFARWQYFQEHGEWPPSDIEEVIAESPIYGGFDWYMFLRAAQEQTRKYPYARTFVNSWHIDTIGPDWRDDYYIVVEYRRSVGGVYDPHAYKGPKRLFPLNDVLLGQLLKVHDEARATTKDLNAADKAMMKFWKARQNKQSGE